MPEQKSVLQPVDAKAVALAKTLLRTARYGALAVIEPGTGAPLASRVGVSTDIDGTPVILISRLAPHTNALLADPRCSLLLGEPGKGDPLAHARISIDCRAREIERDSADHVSLRTRYLAHQPKAGLYAELGDFRFFRLEAQKASLNGGFGRAYAMTPDQFLTLSAINADLAAAEASAVEHMNEDHSEAVALYARHFAGAADGKWVLLGIDADGIDLANGDAVERIFFPEPLASAADMRMALVKMAQQARQQLAS